MNKKIVLTLALSLISTSLMAGDIENMQLIDAVRRNNVADAQAAIEHHADVNVCSLTGHTPLHLAVLNPAGQARREIIMLLVRNGARANLQNDTGQTPADFARNLPDFADIQELLSVGNCPICLEEISPSDAIVRGNEIFGCDSRHIAHRCCIFDIMGNQTTTSCPTCRASQNAPIAPAPQPHIFLVSGDQNIALQPAMASVDSAQQLPAAVLAAMDAIRDAIMHAQEEEESNVDANSEHGTTPLIEAIRQENLGEVQRLLAQGVDVNEIGTDPESGEEVTALGLAASQEHTDILNILLAQPGIDINGRDAVGYTALILAANHGHIDAVTALLAQPNIDVNARSVQANGTTALLVAAQNGHTQTVNALLAHPHIDETLTSNSGINALMFAARGGHRAIVTALLARPLVQINTRNNEGFTALIAAAQQGHLSVVSELLARPNIEVNARTNNGQTALLAAARYGHTNTVASLLAHHDIDVNARNNNGQTALIVAAQNGRAGTIEALLTRHDLEVNASDNEGQNALMAAARNGHLETVIALLQHPDIDIDAQNNQGQTALSLAIQNVRSSVIHFLMEHGAH